MMNTKQREEATRRLNELVEKGIVETDVLKKWDENHLTVTFSCGEMADFDDEDRVGAIYHNLCEHFEKEFPGYMVYHMMELSPIILGLLYVSPNEKAWEDERLSEDRRMEAYVYQAWFDSSELKKIDL